MRKAWQYCAWVSADGTDYSHDLVNRPLAIEKLSVACHSICLISDRIDHFDIRINVSHQTYAKSLETKHSPFRVHGQRQFCNRKTPTSAENAIECSALRRSWNAMVHLAGSSGPFTLRVRRHFSLVNYDCATRMQLKVPEKCIAFLGALWLRMISRWADVERHKEC